MKRVQIVTVSTAPHHKYQKLQKATAAKWGYQYVSIGQGVEWKGFVTKMELPAAYLNNQLAVYDQILLKGGDEGVDNPRDILYVFVDAYDLVFVGPPGDILSKYAAFGTPIVVGAEKTCFGNCKPSTCDDGGPGLLKRFVNTGCVMGPIDDLIRYYEWGQVNYPADDQIAMAMYRNLHCDQVDLDLQSSIVLNYEVDSARDYLAKLENGRFRITETGSTPCIIHCPFIFRDLGTRWDYVLQHALPAYTPLETNAQYFHSLVAHTTKYVRTNKSYLVLTMVVCYLGLISLCAVLGIVWYALSTCKKWLDLQNPHLKT